MGVECGCDFIIGIDAHEPEQLKDDIDYQRCKSIVEKYGGNLICYKEEK
jgi:histidinol phosphatase-like PHP family hydrolase